MESSSRVVVRTKFNQNIKDKGLRTVPGAQKALLSISQD